MHKPPSRIINTFLFLAIFCAVAVYLIFEYGIIRGFHSTFLLWSFYVLCLPISGSGTITSTITFFFTGHTLRFPQFFTWLAAVALNLVSCHFFPSAYMRLVTTFLLYRIVSTPWPFWLIIGASAFGGMYNTFVMRDPTKRYQLKHLLAKTLLTSIGIITFLYLSYIELIVFLSAKTH